MTQDNLIQLSRPRVLSDLLTEILRNGVRALLVQVEGEVAGFLGGHADKLVVNTTQLGEKYWATSIAKRLGIGVQVFGNPTIDNDGPVSASQALLSDPLV
jgi:hypothetical protein